MALISTGQANCATKHLIQLQILNRQSETGNRQFRSDPGEIRTRDLQLRRLLLYPAELRGQDLITNERLVPTGNVGFAFQNPARERNQKAGDPQNGSHSYRMIVGRFGSYGVSP